MIFFVDFFRKVSKSFFIRILACFLFFFLLFSFYFLLGSFNSTDDQFFNIRFAQKLAAEGPSTLTNFDEFSFQGVQSWVYNPLFYVLLIPFTWVQPLEFGIKLFSVSMVALFLTTVYVFFWTRKIPSAFLWTVVMSALFLSAGVYSHFLNARAFVPALPLLVLLFVAFAKRRYEWVGIISFIYFFIHSATFFFPLFIGGVYTVFQLHNKTKNAWQPLWATGLGTISACMGAIAFFPGFADSFSRFFHTLLSIIFSFHNKNTAQISEGIESYPLTIFDLFAHYSIAAFCIVSGIVFESHRLWTAYRKKESFGDPLRNTIFFLMVFFLLGTLITKRNLDFLFVFSILALVPLLSFGWEKYKGYTSQGARAGFWVAIFLMFVSQLFFLADSIASAPPYRGIQGAALWLREHTEENSIVFNPTINFFPTFYFFNEGHNRVIVGIEPRNLYEHDPDLYWLWHNFSEQGIICSQEKCGPEIALRDVARSTNDLGWYKETGEKAQKIIEEKFATDMVITHGAYVPFNEVLEKSGVFERVYVTPITGSYSIYRIKK